MVCPTAKTGHMHKQLIRHQKKRIQILNYMGPCRTTLSVCDSDWKYFDVIGGGRIMTGKELSEVCKL